MRKKNKDMKRLIRKKTAVICGHFGTGKTNIAVNLAISAAIAGKKTIIADLDIVNPYFRTADSEELLKSFGVRTLIPRYANTNVDIPALPPSLPLLFTGGEDSFSVADIGGDEEGAAVLRVLRDDFIKTGYDMFYVYNMFRPENITPREAAKSLWAIEQSSGLKFTGIINNSNLGTETTKELVAGSVNSAAELSLLTSIPVAALTAFAENSPDGADVIKIRDITKKLF